MSSVLAGGHLTLTESRKDWVELFVAREAMVQPGIKETH
jgi:hypothetical protein